MAKLFFEVFPTLQLEGNIKKLLTETEVTKVGMNREKNHLRVYLLGARLIHKKDIYRLEAAIAGQIFKGRQMQVKIIEKYRLSEQYTPEKLLDLYKESILEELRDYSLMEYNLLRTAKMEFQSENRMLLTLENTIIAQTRSHEIVEFLEKVVCERCGLNLAVELAYEEPKESRHKKNSDLQVQFEIQNIVKRVRLREGEQEGGQAVPETDAQQAGTKKAAPAGRMPQSTAAAAASAENVSNAGGGAGGAAFAGGSGASRGKKEFRRKYEGGLRRSDNPDVIYGRDFEDEPIPIEKIVGEMGEVTIRCQIMNMETRDIRNEKTIVILSVTDFTDSIGLKMFTRTDQVAELVESGLKKGAFFRINFAA